MDATFVVPLPPSISVMVPTFDAGRITATITSILSHAHSAAEIIASDDAPRAIPMSL